MASKAKENGCQQTILKAIRALDGFDVSVPKHGYPHMLTKISLSSNVNAAVRGHVPSLCGKTIPVIPTMMIYMTDPSARRRHI